MKEKVTTEKMKDIKRNVITKQTVLETKKIQKIKPQKEPTMTSIKNTKLNSRNLVRLNKNTLKNLESTDKEKEFKQQHAHVEIKKEGVEIKKKPLV